MRTVFFLAFLVINFGCSHKLPTKLIPVDYDFPENQIGDGKTMVYVNANTGDTTFINFYSKVESRKTFLIEYDYDKNWISDSMVLLNRNLVEYYINPDNNGQLWKADKIYDKIVMDKDKNLSELAEFHWQKRSRHVSVRNQTWVIKDTVLHWNGKSLPAIITKNIIQTNSNFLRTPDGKYNFEMESINYIGQHVGTIKRIIVCSWNDKPIVTKLIEIRDMQD